MRVRQGHGANNSRGPRLTWRRSPCFMGANMNFLYIASGLIAVALAIYLIYVLVRPEDF